MDKRDWKSNIFYRERDKFCRVYPWILNKLLYDASLYSQRVALNKFISIKLPFAKLFPFPRVFVPLPVKHTMPAS